MHTEREFLDDLWGRSVPEPRKMPDLDSLRRSEWCDEYEQLRRNRMVMGSFRYGLLAEQDFSKYDLVAEIRIRAGRYSEDGNLEHLVDAGNMCMLAYVHGQRCGHTLRAVDDGKHTLITANAGSIGHNFI